jgi:hypothetical protein
MPQIGLGGRFLICADATVVSVVTFRQFDFCFVDDISYFDGCETSPNKSRNILIYRAVKSNFLIFEPFVSKLLDWFYIFWSRRSVLMCFFLRKNTRIGYCGWRYLLYSRLTLFTCLFHMHMPSVEIIDIMQEPSFTVSRVPTFSGIVLSDIIWHLVAFYVCYIVHIYLEGSLSPASHSKFLGFLTYYLLMKEEQFWKTKVAS